MKCLQLSLLLPSFPPPTPLPLSLFSFLSFSPPPGVSDAAEAGLEVESITPRWLPPGVSQPVFIST